MARGDRTTAAWVLVLAMSLSSAMAFSNNNIIGVFRYAQQQHTRRQAVVMQNDGDNDELVVDSDPMLSLSSRRRVLQTIAFLSSSTSAWMNYPKGALGVIMSNDSTDANVFKAGEAMGTKEALARFQKARESLRYLLDNYDKIVANGGGDNVRRYLGTVGVTSGLYGIPKVLKELQESADDVVEYTEAMNEFDAYLRSADTACYSANFVEFSAAKTKPEKFFEDARLDAERMMSAMDVMANELKVK